MTPRDVVWSFSGVRPLLDDASGDPSAVTRDYTLALDAEGAPLLSILGGKITTFRRLGEEAVDLLLPALGERRAPWTRGAPLPGGDLSAFVGPSVRPDLDIARFLQRMSARYPFVTPALMRRYAHCHGALTPAVLGDAARLEDLGEELAPGLFEAELAYLVGREWARTAEDVLWRRTKVGLRATPAQCDAVQAWMRTNAAGIARG